MTLDITQFNAQALCSRKLWQMVNTPTDRSIGETELQQAINELATRRHYLAELGRIGKLGEDNQGV
jgi:hypothetical protein